MNVQQLLLICLFALVSSVVRADTVPDLSDSLVLVTETWVTDDLRTHLWCAIYKDSASEVVPIWMACSLFPQSPVGLITLTEPYQAPYVVWAAKGFTIE